MNDIILDKCILFLYCMLSLVHKELTPEFVMACLSAAVVASLNFSFPDPPFPPVSCFLYALMTLRFPGFALFLPLILYDWKITDLADTILKLWGCAIDRPFHLSAFSGDSSTGRFSAWRLLILPAAACSIAGFLSFWTESPVFFFLLFGIALALLLQIRTDRYNRLHWKYQKTRDDDTEIQILLEEKNQSLRERQDSELYAATLRERNRIAREIHDNVGHMLTRSILMVGALKIVHKDPDLDQPLNQLEDTLNQAMNSIRQSVHDLHDSSVNLQDTLQTLIRDFTYCPVSLQYDMSPEVPREVKYSFIAIIKEALVNISRHSNATRADISALEHPGFYQLIISDNGCMKDCKPKTESEGIGLANMESRVRSLNGMIQFQKKNGFRIYITVPKKKGSYYESAADR